MNRKNYKKDLGYTLKEVKEACLKKEGRLPKIGRMMLNVIDLGNGKSISLVHDAKGFYATMYCKPWC